MSRANGITRQEILTSIKCNGTMTAEELARELGISQVAVRQHLTSLEAESIITITVERRGLGRPSHRYRLTPQGDETFPRIYERVASGLLEELETWQGGDAVQSLFERRRENMARSMKSRMNNKTLAEKVRELARIQTEYGFMARAEAGSEPGEFRLIEHNCSLCSIAARYPHICCKFEIELFQELLGDVQIEREKYILAGDHTCTYRIGVRGQDSGVREE